MWQQRKWNTRTRCTRQCGSMKGHMGKASLSLFRVSLPAPGFIFLTSLSRHFPHQRQLTLLLEMKKAVAGGAQFIIASHSPILLGYPSAVILSFDGEKIHEISYEETESYQVTEMFINHRNYFLERLLNDEE